MKDQASKRYLWVTVFNVIITAAEIAGGIISGSLALLSDALHNLSDVVSIVVAFAANLIAKRSKDQHKTFGYKRAETLAAYTNGLFLLAISIYLFISAIKRFSKPEPIEGGVMFIVSLIGLAGNLISMLILGKGSKENLNARALFLNMMSDTLSSVAVAVGSLLIYYQNWTLVDPVLTMAAAIFLLKEAFE
ncbi:cation diffusion facilitator family transporter, partial [Lactobacillus delbrueckii subsp. lactis]|nr:cation diffusion facilitator family transporter [Lactobacillus delbrueckii subsp. lactis]